MAVGGVLGVDGGADALDAPAEIRDMQVARWREMSARAKLLLVRDLCEGVEQLARAGIRRDHPDVSEREMLWHLAVRRCGTETAGLASERPADMGGQGMVGERVPLDGA